MSLFSHYIRAGSALTLAILTTALVACSSTPNTTSNSDPTVDFSKYKTFAFLADLSTDKEAYQSLETTYLKQSVGRELEELGLQQVDSDPDLAINFSVETQEKVTSRSVPSGGYGIGYDPYYDVYYDNWGMNHTTRIDQHTEGKLNIDAIDVKSRKLVWQGSTRGRLTSKAKDNYQETLDEAVKEIFGYLKTQE
jgi:Domain of unknown function (DUF4136)